MALNELLKFDKIVPLIPGTGVQFVDFGFSIDKKSDVPVNWGFVDPAERKRNNFVPELLVRGDESPAEGQRMPSYDVAIKDVIAMFDRTWVPLPILRKEAQGYFRGPTNWVRAYLANLAEPDPDGNHFRLVIAIDTNLLEFVESEAYLAPSPMDARNGREFALPSHKENIDWFFAESWVKDWCFETIKEAQEKEDRRKRRFNFRPRTEDEVMQDLQGDNEFVARYKAYLDFLYALDILPSFKFADRYTEPKSPSISVDLVLDLGNSRTCGLLIESDPDLRGVDITKAVTLKLRDLSRAEQVYSDPFPSRFEFAKAQFGRDHLSELSGRSAAFSWQTVVRVGDEAARLAAQRSGTEGASGLSSPKRYLWDGESRADSWRFNTADHDAGTSTSATGVKFTTLVNDDGEPLHLIAPADSADRPDRGLPALRALFSRRNLTSFALAEIFVQAISMMNSPMFRQMRPANAQLPRRLRRVIMTMPTAMPLVERRILEQQARAACDLALLSLDLAEVIYAEDGTPALKYSEEVAEKPQIILQWDEATATQAVYLYSQVALNHSGDARTFFDTVRHPANRQDAANGNRLRLATIDLGGGTTDLVVTSITVEGTGANVTMIPEQEFREGFNLAGDDALLRVVREHVVEPIKRKLRDMGLGEKADAALYHLIGGDRGDMKAIELVRRQQFATQIAAPIALGMLQEYETYDALAPVESFSRKFSNFFNVDNTPTSELVGYVNAELAKKGARDFRLEDMEFEIDPVQIDLTVRSVFQEMLQALGEVVHRYRCDVLILSGRTSRLPAVRQILEESGAIPSHRIVSLHQFRVGRWYPFRDYRATVGDPKTTAAVGAMICLLGNGELQNFNFRSNYLRPKSTARYFGKLDQANRLLKADEFYNNLDLDNVDYELPESTFEFRGPMPLGFRQLDVDWWPATRLYYIDYASPEAARKYNPETPLAVSIKRAGGRTKNPLTGEEFIDNPGLAIRGVKGQKSTVPPSMLKLRLQTLNDSQGYWLDTGILLGS